MDSGGGGDALTVDGEIRRAADYEAEAAAEARLRRRRATMRTTMVAGKGAGGGGGVGVWRGRFCVRLATGTLIIGYCSTITILM